MSAVARNGRLLEGRTTLVTEIRSCRGNRSSFSNAFLICMSIAGYAARCPIIAHRNMVLFGC